MKVTEKIFRIKQMKWRDTRWKGYPWRKGSTKNWKIKKGNVTSNNIFTKKRSKVYFSNMEEVIAEEMLEIVCKLKNETFSVSISNLIVPKQALFVTM